MPEPGSIQWVVEKLDRRHDRASFDCGIASLNDFLIRFASQNQKTGISLTYVALTPGDPRVLGYYTIATGSVTIDHLPAVARARLPRYPVPVAHLGRLAVDRTAQGQRLGEHLLLDALRRIAATADSIAIHAIEVWAINDAAKRFYLKYGFVELLDDPNHLYIAMATLRQLGLV